MPTLTELGKNLLPSSTNWLEKNRSVPQRFDNLAGNASVGSDLLDPVIPIGTGTQLSAVTSTPVVR